MIVEPVLKSFGGMPPMVIDVQINILAQTSEVLETSEVFRALHFSETL